MELLISYCTSNIFSLDKVTMITKRLTMKDNVLSTIIEYGRSQKSMCRHSGLKMSNKSHVGLHALS